MFLRLSLIPISAFALFFVLLLINPWVVVDASPKGLGDSLGAEVSGGSGSCDRVPNAEHLICDVEIDPGSGPGARYVLRQDGDHCWQAVQVTRRNRGPRPAWVPDDLNVAGKQLSGCATLVDELVPSIL